MNAFDQGDAAFVRVWGGASITRIGLFRQVHWRNTLAPSKTGYTGIPGGPLGFTGTLGGSGLAVSRHSSHRKEAIELIRFLIRAQIHANQVEESAAVNPSELPSPSSLSNASRNPEDAVRTRFLIRPSSESGSQYEQIARAYIDAVHSVLTGEKPAPQAAAVLEEKLVRITGFKTGPPLKGD